ncbi:hypothetical protein HanPSC8_Chr12g0524011 [Helianthus annuus]|nr:hypothetical protein HanPSC8_Chr12g0524011 [Helianthus annuus]
MVVCLYLWGHEWDGSHTTLSHTIYIGAVAHDTNGSLSIWAAHLDGPRIGAALLCPFVW